MVPLRPEAHEHVLLRLGVEEAPGLLALRHAILFRKPGLWGDDARRPHTVLLLRPAGPGREAFGAGRAEAAVAWLAARQGRITLVAPEEWEPAVRSVVGTIERQEVVTWFDPPVREPGNPSRAEVRRLGRNDQDVFLDLAPDWALRSWGSYDEMTRFGAAFGVPHGDGLAAVAWVLDQTERFDALGVYTRPHYRRLGLGRAVARAAIRHTQRERAKLPLWSAASDNPASNALARTLGFTGQSTEPLLRWPAERNLETQEVDEVRL